MVRPRHDADQDRYEIIVTKVEGGRWFSWVNKRPEEGSADTTGPEFTTGTWSAAHEAVASAESECGKLGWWNIDWVAVRRVRTGDRREWKSPGRGAAS